MNSLLAFAINEYRKFGSNLSGAIAGGLVYDEAKAAYNAGLSECMEAANSFAYEGISWNLR